MLRFWIAGSIPFILIFIVTWIPQVNGAHVWFGMPAIFVWVLVIATFGVPAVLAYFEFTRTDLDEEGNE